MSLNCPRSGNPLKQIEIDGVKIDVSAECGGAWFDNYELKKFSTKDKTAGDSLLEELGKISHPPLDLNEKLKCPKCTDVVMMRSFYSPQKQVEIDTCPTCNGVWLDPGELTMMRELFSSDQDKKFYVQEFANSVMDKNLQELRDFILPSDYVNKFLNPENKED